MPRSLQVNGPCIASTRSSQPRLHGWLSLAGFIWETSDGGLHWHRLLAGGITASGSYNSGLTFIARHVDNVSEFVRTNQDGRVRKVCRADASWLPVGQVRFVSPTEAYSTVRKTRNETVRYGIVRSTDGGCTWSLLRNTPPSERVIGSSFVSERTGAITLYGGHILTTNNMSSWKRRPCPFGSKICFDPFVSDNGFLWVAVNAPNRATGYTGIAFKKDPGSWQQLSRRAPVRNALIPTSLALWRRSQNDLQLSPVTGSQTLSHQALR